MKSSSLRLIGNGINDPSRYRDALIHTWYLPQEYKNHLEVYILKETTVEEFIEHSKDGILTIQGKQYSITWIHSPSKIKKSDNRRLLVSIRYCKELDRGYALVKLLEGDGFFDRLDY